MRVWVCVDDESFIWIFFVVRSTQSQKIKGRKQFVKNFCCLKIYIIYDILGIIHTARVAHVHSAMYTLCYNFKRKFSFRFCFEIHRKHVIAIFRKYPCRAMLEIVFHRFFCQVLSSSCWWGAIFCWLRWKRDVYYMFIESTIFFAQIINWADIRTNVLNPHVFQISMQLMKQYIAWKTEIIQ